MGNILALRMGPEFELAPNPWQDTEISGLAAILAVRTIVTTDPTTTTFIGNTLICMNDVGSLSSVQLIKRFLGQYYNKSVTWAEVDSIPRLPYQFRLYLVPQNPENPPRAMQPLTLLDSGFDPATGYWMKFDGNFSTFLLFKGNWQMIGCNDE